MKTIPPEKEREIQEFFEWLNQFLKRQVLEFEALLRKIKENEIK